MNTQQPRLITTLILLCLLYAATAYGQDFVCGFGLAGEEATGQSSHNEHYYRSSSKRLSENPLCSRI